MPNAAKRILIVDDDPLVREVAVKKLEAAGFAVFEAADGAEGFEKARADPPDLVIVDLMMPVMHGYDLCEKLKSDQTLKAARIIVISGKRYEADKKVVMRLGADGYLEKPYTGTQLLKLAEHFLAKA